MRLAISILQKPNRIQRQEQTKSSTGNFISLVLVKETSASGMVENDAEKSIDIDPQEAQQTLKIAEANLNKAEGKRQKIEANLALRRARTRVEAINRIS
ncbi:ATP synthase, delta/epsilon chain, long alpha-helix protein [Medicago truncatula]|uniref:ATP synthase, delta/epsilon chain, long alpha-helix protein n=1 Tax=Medicago truncatula TaxID=3880 RepID=G7J7Q4_MEDTR|nr:ATP synthase, delta/epsilon chain, long alpha-helix protein [Medicago truncatula]